MNRFVEMDRYKNGYIKTNAK